MTRSALLLLLYWNLDVNAQNITEFTGFNVSLKLTTAEGYLIDQYNFRVDTTDNQGVYTYTSLRPETLSTTISIAWATNIPPPSFTTTTEFTGSTPTRGPTEEPTTTPKLPSDCDEISNRTSGVHIIYPDGKTPVSVYCEQKNSLTYTVIQSRGTVGNNISFDIPFANYSDWFGEAGIGNNFWIGLDNMNALSTNGKSYSLQIDLCCGSQLIAKQIYHNFKVDTKANQYTLTATVDIPGIGLDYASTGKDIGAPFSTYKDYKLPKGKPECDQFEYEDDDGNLSIGYGGWWFGSCGNNLNGFLYESIYGNCKVTRFATTKLLGINMRTSSGQGVGGYDVDLVSYDRVRMALFTFDSINVDRLDDTFCR
uniref:Fibrinogen C-terminal domain-containing protein n=1 Tax=Caenorhabditis japonica TaxID=281687 RepID=A0A8R1E1H7_CAEJA